MASGYASVKTIDYHHGLNQGYAQVQGLDTKYKLTAAMLAVLAGMWVRGGAGLDNIVGGLLRPVAPAAGTAAQQRVESTSRTSASSLDANGRKMKKKRVPVAAAATATKQKVQKEMQEPLRSGGVASQFESERERSF